MAFPPGKLYKCVMFGKMAADDWSVGVWKTENSARVGDLNLCATDLANLFDTDVWSGPGQPLKGYNRPVCTFDGVKVYEYTSGVLTGQGQSTFTSSAGANASATSPAYTAVCCTLQTAGFGRSARGRMYLPITAGPYGTNLQFSSLDALAVNMAAFLGGITNPDTWDVDSVVFSQKNGSTAKVTALRIDSLPDTQRGRQNKAVASGSWTHSVGS